MKKVMLTVLLTGCTLITASHLFMGPRELRYLISDTDEQLEALQQKLEELKQERSLFQLLAAEHLNTEIYPQPQISELQKRIDRLKAERERYSERRDQFFFY